MGPRLSVGKAGFLPGFTLPGFLTLSKPCYLLVPQFPSENKEDSAGDSYGPIQVTEWKRTVWRMGTLRGYRCHLLTAV